MKILSIETSCDETALAILEVSGGAKKPKIKVLAHKIASQIQLHQQYGGVFPMMAKREHSRNILPLFLETLKEAKIFREISNYQLPISKQKEIEKMLEREQELLPQFLEEIPKIKKPKFDAICVTTGPGLEPALWVGINFAKALGNYWKMPVVAVNHMEGHILSVLVESKVNPKQQAPKSKQIKSKASKIPNIQFPAMALLVSGGHTELVLVKSWMHYKKIGQTRDDAAGEAFDKVARMLGLPYPGGPQISRLAAKFRESNVKGQMSKVKLPRPMLSTDDFDFSFSGLKTAVLYLIRDLQKNDPSILQNTGVMEEIACEFENAVMDVLIHKTLKAVKKFKVKTVIVGGGVAANTYLRERLSEAVMSGSNVQGQTRPNGDSAERMSNVPNLFFPSRELSTDNAVMIGIAGYLQFYKKKKSARMSTLVAKGNLTF